MVTVYQIRDDKNKLLGEFSSKKKAYRIKEEFKSKGRRVRVSPREFKPLAPKTAKSYNRKVKSRSAKSPADETFSSVGLGHLYLLEDGSIAWMSGDSDPIDFEDECDEDDLEDFARSIGVKYEDLWDENGYLKMGLCFFDIWTSLNKSYDGGAFWYYDDETIRSYCNRNGEELPVKELPSELLEILEKGDAKAFEKYRKKYPELRNF